MTLWGIFFLGAWNAGRVFVIGQHQKMLLELETGVDPRLRLVIAIVWMIIFWTLTVLLRQGRSVTRWAIPILLLSYGLFELGLLFLFAKDFTARRAWLLDATFYLIMVLSTYWALNRSAAKHYFEEKRFERRN